MPPYPFIAAMPFKKLRARLEDEYGCRFEEGDEVKNHRGESFRIFFVSRVVDGNEIQRTIDFGADDEMVNPNVLRATCKRLMIDVADFGYHLG